MNRSTRGGAGLFSTALGALILLAPAAQPQAPTPVKDQSERTLTGHTSVVRTVAVSPDGNTLASCGTDGTIRLWDVASGKELARPGEKVVAWRLAFSPDGRQIAWGHIDGLTAWDRLTGSGRDVFQKKLVQVVGLAFSPDGQWLAAACGSDRTVRLCNLQTGQERLCGGHKTHVVSVAFRPDGRQLASAGTDKLIKLWEVATGQEQGVLVHKLSIYSLAYSPDGKRLAAAGGNYSGPHASELKIWDVEQRQERVVLAGHGKAIVSAVFSPDGRRLATASCDQTIKVWEVLTGQVALTLTGHVGYVHSVAFFPDGRRLVSAGADRSIKIWDLGKPDDRPELSRQDLEAVWADLSGADAVTAFRASWLLIQVPELAVPFFAGRLKPGPAPEARRITGLIADLDADEFSVREEASRALEKLGEQAESALAQAAEKHDSPEVRGRARQLLEKLRSGTPSLETRRLVRTIEVLEHMGTPAADELLRKLAQGLYALPVTQEANAALQRRSRRAAPTP